MQSQDYDLIETFSLFYGLMSVPFTFMFAPKFYYAKKYDMFLYIINIIFAILAFVLPNHSLPEKPNLNLFLLCPLYSLLILRFGLYIFKKYKKRYPTSPGRDWLGKDTEHNADRWFQFLFFTISLCVPMFVLAYCYP